jgi:hypothetical protein
MQKADLAWQIRGYPWMVEHKLKGNYDILSAIDWCQENLAGRAYSWIGGGRVVFVDRESAAQFLLTWGYDR